MSLENAKKLAEEMRTNSELKAKMEQKIKSAFPEDECGCTYEEFKESCILMRQLDESELDTVTGGTAFTCNIDWDADRHGGCSSNYYKQECTATVEDGSWCSSNDWCYAFDSLYTKKK